MSGPGPAQNFRAAYWVVQLSVKNINITVHLPDLKYL